MRLRHYLYIVSLAALAACNSEELTPSDAVGEEIRLSAATLGDNAAVTTRTITTGSPKAFTAGTAITLQVSGTWTKQSSSESVVKTTIATAAASTTTRNDLTLGPALYWDDFGTADPNNKDTGRKKGLTIYGAAMDGVTDKTKAPKVDNWAALEWDLGDNQTSGISALDLLLSNNVNGDNTYKFDARESGKQLEFYHVLSKITVNIKAGDGFTKDELANSTQVVLTSNQTNENNEEWAYTKGTFDVTDVTTGKPSKLSLTARNAVIMAQAGTPADDYAVTKEALVMPGSTFNNDAATIMSINADGNIYYVTAEKIRTAINATDHANGTAYPTEAGKNYIFKVIVNKTGVTVTATVKDWDTVDSEQETPAISFTADVTSNSNTTAGSSLSSGDTFTLWKTSAFTETALAAAETTTVTYDGSKYTYDPTLYWQSAKDNSYFRALATMTTTTTATETTTSIAAITDVAATDKNVSQGTDFLWGTTDKHTGTYTEGSKEYAEGDAINPRTGDVPLIFKHAMSKVVVELSTSMDAAAVVLTDATVTLTNLATAGTISLETGNVTASTSKDAIAVNAAEKALDATTSYSNLIMVPQSIGDMSRLIVTLKDGTTYSLQLNTCKADANSPAITTWAGGSKYTYNITLKKQEISFRVLVQDWDKKEGSGNASLDWD